MFKCKLTLVSFGHIFSKRVQATLFKITGITIYTILCAMLYIIKHNILRREWHNVRNEGQHCMPLASFVSLFVQKTSHSSSQVHCFLKYFLTKVLSSLCRDSRMINCHFVWPAVHMPERGRETRLVPVALSSFISIIIYAATLQQLLSRAM